MRPRIKVAIVVALALCPIWLWRPLSAILRSTWPGFRDV
jgi:hypothetical protein